MKVGTVNVKVSAVSLAVVLTFTLIFLIYVVLTGDWDILVWGLPSLLLLLLIPLGLNYLSQKQYKELVPVYEQEAKKVSAKAINLGMIQKPVRLEGVVERVYFQYLNRPQYLVADRSGEVSVKMFTSPQEKIRKGDVVEVLGTVMKRYILTGDAVVNCVSIRKIDRSEKSS
ncbi:MAG: nucleotide-binding protein [Methanomicrobiaceae archaeon]|nr:nucleotide-binding protein [Methanomicrobiaceae archaeon]